MNFNKKVFVKYSWYFDRLITCIWIWSKFLRTTTMGEWMIVEYREFMQYLCKSIALSFCSDSNFHTCFYLCHFYWSPKFFYSEFEWVHRNISETAGKKKQRNRLLLEIIKCDWNRSALMVGDHLPCWHSSIILTSSQFTALPFLRIPYHEVDFLVS